MTLQELRVFLNGWFCGCSQPWAAVARLRDILALHPLYENRRAFDALVPDVGIQMLLLYTLGYFELNEHGGGIGGAWLTDKGKVVLEAICAHDPEVIAASSCVHGYALEEEYAEPCPKCGS